MRGNGDRVVLVGAGTFVKLYAPSVSPDGKWVVFASYDAVSPEKDGSSLLDWLFFTPKVARAHDAPWDIYLVPTQANAQVSRLTNLGEDEPSTTWIDNQNLAIMGERAMYHLGIDAAGKALREPLPVREGVQHSGISWKGP
jgi:Tol biopolymer transport system component